MVRFDSCFFVLLKNALPNPMSQTYSPMFSSKICIVLVKQQPFLMIIFIYELLVFKHSVLFRCPLQVIENHTYRLIVNDLPFILQLSRSENNMYIKIRFLKRVPKDIHQNRTMLISELWVIIPLNCTLWVIFISLLFLHFSNFLNESVCKLYI